VDQLNLNQVSMHEAVLQQLTHRSSGGAPAVVRRLGTSASVTSWDVGTTTGAQR
jgi:hypothetical protein